MKYRAGSVGRRSLKDVTTKIRSFLRWLHMTGQTSRDLSSTVIAPMLYAFESIPSALRAEDVKEVLAVTRQDCTPKGIRDYAILMLISKYGVRSGEITTLRLDDVDWRKEVIRIRHSKTGAISYLPLLPEVGEAILKYLQDSRPKTSFREMFIRTCAPYRPFRGGSSLYRLVRHRLEAANVITTGKRGPHAFRHARAVSMLRAAVASEGDWGSAGSPCSGLNIGVSEARDGGLACRGLGDSDGGEGMKTASMSKGATPENYVRQLRLRSPVSSQVYLSILNGFQRFVAEKAENKSVSQTTIRQWLKDRTLVWPFHIVTDRARLVDRFLDWRVSNGALANNPFADLRKEYGQRTTTPIVRALLNPNSEAALEALRPASALRQFSGPGDARACGPYAGHGLPLQHAGGASAPAGPVPSGPAGSFWPSVDGVDSRMDEYTIHPAACVGLPPDGQTAFQGAVSYRSNCREDSFGQTDLAGSESSSTGGHTSSANRRFSAYWRRRSAFHLPNHPCGPKHCT